ncbi:MAG TPA: adenylate/guanylate cyclase domain-containing protein [Candidatus Limnocylindria bacterium]
MTDERATGWLQRYVRAGIAPGDDDRRQLRKATLTLVATIVTLLSPTWIGTYLVLDRPLAALIPAIYVAMSLAGLAVLFTTKRDGAFVVSQVAAIFILPIALQWVLGGFVHASAVALWSFAAVLLALIAWGIRPAALVFAGFVAAMVVSGVAEGALRDQVPPLPEAVESAFFVLNVSAPLATALALLVYFNRERDAAMAASDRLLLNILPSAIVRRLKVGGRPVADRHDEATVTFIDFVNFTQFAERMEPERVVDLLDRAFSALDGLAARFGVEKIKTLGDGYLGAAGVTDARPDHAEAVAEMALASSAELEACLGDEWPDFKARIGIATGPVVAGVIGEQRIGFDLWGDTVNTAARMASHAAPGTIQVTERTCRSLSQGYRLERHDDVQVKGKGAMTTYVLLGRRPEADRPAVGSAGADQ